MFPFPHKVRLLAAITFSLSLIALLIYRQAPLGFYLYYAILNLVTFAWYAYDKRQAEQQQWRTPEIRLHLLALFGGYTGAMWGQQLLYHKVNKAVFSLIPLASAVLHLGILLVI